MSITTSTRAPAQPLVWEVREHGGASLLLRTADLDQAGQAVAAFAEAGQAAAIYPAGAEQHGLAPTSGELMVLRASELTSEHAHSHLWLLSPERDVLSGTLLWTCPLTGYAGHVSMLLVGVRLSLGYGLSYEAEVPVNLDFPVVLA